MKYLTYFSVVGVLALMLGFLSYPIYCKHQIENERKLSQNIIIHHEINMHGYPQVKEARVHHGVVILS